MKLYNDNYKKNILCIIGLHKWSIWYRESTKKTEKEEYKISSKCRYKICERKNCRMKKKQIIEWEKIENERV